jgi:hypothetical protein
MKKTTKLQIEDCKLQIEDWAKNIGRKILGRAKLMPNAYSNNHLTPNTLITFPQYLKIPIRFWTSNVGHEIRSSFDLELYERVCEARGVESGVKVEY